MYVHNYRTNGSAADGGCFLNTQLDGTSHKDKYFSFLALAQRWRLAYAGVTCYQDGPDLSNQGTIVVSQPPVMPVQRYASPVWLDTLEALTPINMYTDEDLPDYERSQSMPNAYFNRSREGAYVPLKLTESCQDWVSESDDVCFCKFTFAPVHSCIAIIPESIGADDVYPHCVPGSLGGGDLQALTIGYTGGVMDSLTGDRTSKMLNGTFAHISARNLDPATSYTFFFRFGIEMQVSPSSVIAPQMKLSPPHDAKALDTYFSIARELKDAYPANYNDLGKLWDVISGTARKVLPYVATMGPTGQLVNRVGTTALGVGDYIRNKKKKGKKPTPRGVVKVLNATGRDRPAAAEVERAQQQKNAIAAVRGK